MLDTNSHYNDYSNITMELCQNHRPRQGGYNGENPARLLGQGLRPAHPSLREAAAGNGSGRQAKVDRLNLADWAQRQ